MNHGTWSTLAGSIMIQWLIYVHQVPNKFNQPFEIKSVFPEVHTAQAIYLTWKRSCQLKVGGEAKIIAAFSFNLRIYNPIASPPLIT